MKFNQWSILVTMVLLNGCGGGESGNNTQEGSENNEIKIGKFLDSPVEGVSYKTPTQEGLTGSDGSFKYLDGENIEFYINNLKFGRAKAQEIITPVNLTGAGSLFDQKVVNILQILQTADEDQNPDNGIKIIQSNTPLTGVGSLDLSVDEINPEDLLKTAGFLEETIVSAQEAISHFQGEVKGSIKGLKSDIDNFRATMQSIDTNRIPISNSELKSVSEKYYEQAYLSNRIYEDSASDLHIEKDGWTLIWLDYQTNGFKAGLYQESASNNYIISYGGTTASIKEFSDTSKYIDIALDVLTDIKLFSNLPLNPNQAKSALEILNDSIVATAISNKQVSFITGHSLGGGLAQYAGLYTGIDTVTFNTAPLPFNNDSIDPFLNKYNYDTNRFALQIASRNDKGDVTTFEFSNKNKITNIMAQKDPVSFMSLTLMGLEDASTENKNLDTFVLAPIKFSLLIANQLKLNYLITGKRIYLPINTGSASNDHSMGTIYNLFTDNYSPNIVAPTNLKVEINYLDANLTWDAIQGVEDYKICLSKQPIIDSVCSSENNISTSLTNNYTFYSLKPNQKYYVGVFYQVDSTKSAMSDIFEFSIEEKDGDFPLTLDSVTESTINLSWIKPNGATSYKVCQSGFDIPYLSANDCTNLIDGDWWEPVLTESLNVSTSPNGEVLRASTVYYFRVIAVDDANNIIGVSTEISAKIIEGEETIDSLVLEEFNGNIVNGIPHGITYEDSPAGQAAVFTRTSESRVQYPYSSGFPKEGTIEFLIRVDNAYNYRNYGLNDDQDCGLIFTTDVQGGDVTWAGSSWVYVCKNGDITFHIAGEKYEAGWNAKYRLKAENTEFRFGEWNKIGISYGDEGRHIILNGSLVASNINQTEILGAGGTHSSPVDHPTLGESVPGFWSNNQYEGGFEGAVDRFRVSEKQKDWHISK